MLTIDNFTNTINSIDFTGLVIHTFRWQNNPLIMVTIDNFTNTKNPLVVIFSNR